MTMWLEQRHYQSSHHLKFQGGERLIQKKKVRTEADAFSGSVLDGRVSIGKDFNVLSLYPTQEYLQLIYERK